MIRNVLSLGLLMATAPAFAGVDLAAEDRAAIHAAAQDYAQGWYSGDRERMARSLHDTLAKRAWLPDDEGGRRFDEVDKSGLLSRVTPANAERYANAPKRADVEILDGFGHVATVTLRMDGWVDYLQLAEVPGEGWKIVNVLWALEPAPGAGGPERLEPGALSTSRNEYNLSEAGDLRVFARSGADFAGARIWLQRRVGDVWGVPEEAPLPSGADDSDPWLTPDGRWLYFVSNRRAPDRDAARRDLDLWRLAIDAQGRFGAPEHLGATVNSPGMELGPELHDGVLYFNSTRSGGPAPLSIYAAPLDAEGRPNGPRPLPEPFNAGVQQGDFTLSPDGRYAVFWSQRAGSEAGDLYAVARRGGAWSGVALRLPSPINSDGFDFTPAFSPDGSALRFASDRRVASPEGQMPVDAGLADLYAVPTRTIEAALRED